MLNWDELNRVAERVAKREGRGYRDVHWEDTRQELMLWMAAHAETVAEWLKEANADDAPELGIRYLNKTLYRLAKRYIRRERARMTGYRPQDEWFYSIGQLNAMLRLWYNETPVQDWPDTDMRLDLERAMPRLDGETRNTLRLAYSGDPERQAADRLVGMVHGLSEEGGRSVIRRAVRELQDVLGGPSPWVGRRAISNAQARHITGGQYDDE